MGVCLGHLCLLWLREVVSAKERRFYVWVSISWRSWLELKILIATTEFSLHSTLHLPSSFYSSLSCIALLNNALRAYACVGVFSDLRCHCHNFNTYVFWLIARTRTVNRGLGFGYRYTCALFGNACECGVSGVSCTSDWQALLFTVCRVHTGAETLCVRLLVCLPSRLRRLWWHSQNKYHARIGALL